MIIDALTYPFRNNGWAALIVGTLFMLLYAFIGGGLLGIIFLSFFFTYFLAILGSTITGHDELPFWPDYSGFIDSLIAPAFRFYVVMILSMALFLGVTLTAGFVVPETLADGKPWWFIVGVLLGIVYALTYLPLGVLSISVNGSALSALPHVIIPAIARLGVRYLLPLLIWIFGMGVNAAFWVLSEYLPYAGVILASAVSFYFLLFQARLLGLFYLKNRYVIAWE